MSLLSLAIKNSALALKNKDAFLQFLPKLERVVDRGITFTFHFYDPKVLDLNTSTNPPIIRKRDPLMPPFEEHVFLDHWTAPCAHNVVLNRYMFCPGHILVCSDNAREIQGSDLLSHDFSAIEKLMKSVDDRGVLYYNGGIDAGCTQYHKHFQYLPCYENQLFDEMANGRKLPYLYYVEYLDDYSSSTIGQTYEKLMKSVGHKGSYNFLISKRVMAIIPRRKARHSTQVLVNSMGMCGHLFVSDKNYEDAKKEPLSLITDVCIPIQNTDSTTSHVCFSKSCAASCFTF